jgi:ribonuclease VapC
VQAGETKSNAAIALADCFCAASAKKNSATIVTGDPEYQKIAEEFEILWLPKKPAETKSR